MRRARRCSCVAGGTRKVVTAAARWEVRSAPHCPGLAGGAGGEVTGTWRVARTAPHCRGLAGVADPALSLSWSLAL